MFVYRLNVLHYALHATYPIIIVQFYYLEETEMEKDKKKSKEKKIWNTTTHLYKYFLEIETIITLRNTFTNLTNFLGVAI